MNKKRQVCNYSKENQVEIVCLRTNSQQEYNNNMNGADTSDQLRNVCRICINVRNVNLFFWSFSDLLISTFLLKIVPDAHA